MIRIDNVADLEKNVFKGVRQLRDRLVELMDDDIETVEDGLRFVRSVRDAIYEDLNQLLHEQLLLAAIRWLSAAGFGGKTVWSWNPRQTGGSSELDLEGVRQDRIIVSAEATTSTRPVGVIDGRMKATLVKLNSMSGIRFYFVTTPSMEQRANTKVSRLSLDIRVVLIDTTER